jgi:hypothetical protein
MKRFFAILLCAFATIYTVSAQKKGDVYMGGNLGIGVSHTSATYEGYGDFAAATAIDFSLAPNIGIFVADNFMVGLGLSYGVESSDDDIAIHSLFVGPTLSYYLPLGKNFYYTPTLDFGFCYTATDGEGVPGFGLGLSVVGLEYRPTPKMGISGSLISLDYALLARDGLKVNMVDFGFKLNPTVGLKFYF